MESLPVKKQRKRRKNKTQIKNETNKNLIGFNFSRNSNWKNIKKQNDYYKKITDKRITLRHGLFTKGVRSETITKSGLSEESKARIQENLHKIIDLANSESKFKKTNENHLYPKKLLSEENVLNCKSVSTLSYLNSEYEKPNSRQSNGLDFKLTDNTNVIQSKKSKLSSDFFYQDFMNSLPKEIEKYLPEESCQENVTYLKTYIKTAYQNSIKERNIIKTHPISTCKIEQIKNAEEKSDIIMNPLKYLKSINQNIVSKINTTSITKDDENDEILTYHPLIVHTNDSNKTDTSKYSYTKFCDDVSSTSTKIYKAIKYKKDSVDFDSFDSSCEEIQSPSFEIDEISTINFKYDTPEPTFYPRKI